ncbi:hypothetical protein J7T55_008163 [Diaporthe amygdali]|uniref:uncharacterized protein n=1 Tax=Phomopsis amygdali TaxID=1214568 RepID=UPI0022FEF9D0|nr:uncharacterized protein J7T55_008163 [Diaporthe amygdali]KAJ0108027.1 hypothetical protein J7T55_008163 [Diaporthe amygdali]
MCVDNDDGVRVDDDGDGEGEDEGEVDGQVQGAGQMFSRYFRWHSHRVMGSISIRKHIRWGAEPPSEPTSTLVLTSPGRRFVDIRVLTTASAGLDLDSHLGHESFGSLATDRLDWAFAGTSSSTKATRPDGSEATHSVFNHWVDSRTTEPQLVRDEGDMVPCPGGLALEVGSMVNPATGILTAYEELWYDKKPALTSATPPECIVFQLLDEPGARRGLFVRLGPYAQGVLRVGNTFTAERWAWSENLSSWEQIVKIGDNHDSLGFLLDEQRRSDKVGDQVEAPMGTWTVIEQCI